MKKFTLPQSMGFCYSNTHGQKNPTACARMARISNSRHFLALPKSAFVEHASNNNPSLKQLTKKRKKRLYQ